MFIDNIQLFNIWFTPPFSLVFNVTFKNNVQMQCMKVFSVKYIKQLTSGKLSMCQELEIFFYHHRAQRNDQFFISDAMEFIRIMQDEMATLITPKHLQIMLVCNLAST